MGAHEEATEGYVFKLWQRLLREGSLSRAEMHGAICTHRLWSYFTSKASDLVPATELARECQIEHWRRLPGEPIRASSRALLANIAPSTS